MTRIRKDVRDKVFRNCEAKLFGREVTDRYNSPDDKGEARKNDITDFDNMVECHYQGAVIYVPARLFVRMTMKKDFVSRKFLRYKEGAKMYGMSLSSFKELVRDSGALYHPSEKIALINIERLDEYLELFRE